MKALFHTLTQLEKSMSHHRDRQAVIASNIANVETPGYRPVDLVASGSSESAPSLVTTHGAHFDSASAGNLGGSVVTRDDTDPRPDGNTVSLDQQMARMNQNRLRYTASASLVSRRIALLRYAASDGHA